MQRIFTIIGARPQFIKASVVSRAIANSDGIEETLLHTGQHFDANMSDVFFEQLGIPRPHIQLNIHSGTHGAMTGRMLEEIEKILLVEKPDAVLVYGDTNSTLAGALAAAKLHIPIAHVEAGLRSFNMAMPEEINRILTDRISSILFCPTDTAVQNLLHEGFALMTSPQPLASDHRPLVLNTGDVMYDVALYYGAQVGGHNGLLGSFAEKHGIKVGDYCLATIHRAENTDDPQRLKNVIEGLLDFSKEVPVILPLHPRTRKILESLYGSQSTIHDSRSLILIDPVGYLDMVQLEKHAALIATDSGGVQKEAFFYRVPCVTLREETEWVELIQSGWNRLAPPSDKDTVISALRTSIGTRGQDVKPYGKGDAAKLIVKYLINNNEHL